MSKEESGIGNFSLIHDMFTVDRKRVVAFCDAILTCRDEFTWACSALTYRIHDELIARMARAGCRGIFFGIETGSERLQRAIKKKFRPPGGYETKSNARIGTESKRRGL